MRVRGWLFNTEGTEGREMHRGSERIWVGGGGHLGADLGRSLISDGLGEDAICYMWGSRRRKRGGGMGC